LAPSAVTLHSDTSVPLLVWTASCYANHYHLPAPPLPSYDRERAGMVSTVKGREEVRRPVRREGGRVERWCWIPRGRQPHPGRTSGPTPARYARTGTSSRHPRPVRPATERPPGDRSTPRRGEPPSRTVRSH